ncbi:hypothetical protein [Streptomyces guryensis]|uniref:Transposase of IS4/5 family n=1 Tax=Streptomyces guryensis TaxID=2886947 RepID=A0A9Q3Z9G5_9ACTN|nr:hypothetical protein [Streptomyces guryensis]MCD9879703.1 hypothetical protein [Streptomyces guryensis]
MTDAEWAQVRRLLLVPAWLRGRGGQPEAYGHTVQTDTGRPASQCKQILRPARNPP